MAVVTPETFELLAASLLADVFRQVEFEQWLARAEEFERCKPRPDQWHGNATREELSARWQRCDEIARACRNRATMCLSEDWSTLILLDLRDRAAQDDLGVVA